MKDKIDKSCSLKVVRAVDCTDAFTTKEVFTTRDDLLNWVNAVGRQFGVVVVTPKSDTCMRNVGINTKFFLSCELSGKYKPWNKASSSNAIIDSKKCNCPFRLKAKSLKNDGGWIVNVMCGLHNHSLAKTLVGHSFVDRLSAKEKSLVRDKSKNLVNPIEKVTRTEMQHLLSLLDDNKYVYSYRRVNGVDNVRDIFWAHPYAVTLLNNYHTVLVIDITYKMKNSRLPMFEVAGVTATCLTFSVSFAYLEHECEDNFVWALQRLRGLITKDDTQPQVIVTVHNNALMNAIATVFPSSVNLLCQDHIKRNVMAKCKLNVFPKEEIKLIMEAWDALTLAIDEGEYAHRLVEFGHLCSPFRDFWDYVQNTWLLSHKERFVTAWTNRVMHLGNTTTKRVKSAHLSFKCALQNTMGDFCACSDGMEIMLMLQHDRITTSFYHSSERTQVQHMGPFYAHLRGKVSRDALSHIVDGYGRVNNVEIDSSTCVCTIRTTHGLPCVCELARYVRLNVPVPLDAVHHHWRV